jgi:hypothetical protein
MSSFLQKSAFALIALSLVLPALGAASVSERPGRGLRAQGPISDASNAHGSVATLGETGVHPGPAVSAPSQGRSGPDRAAEGWLHLGPILDGEHDELESVDDPVVTDRGPLPSLGRSRAALVAPLQFGFSEGLFAARASRGPPLD